jgi:HEAT repeat protein
MSDNPLPVLQFSVSPQELHKQAKAVVEAALGSDEPAHRSHGLECLALMGSDLDAPARVRRHLHDSVVAVRFAAAMAAGDMKTHSAKPILERMLREDNPTVQMAAAYALEKMGDQRFKKWYDHVLASDEVQLSGQACMILGKLGETPDRQDSKRKLWAVLKKDDQAVSVKLQAAEALARLGDESILKNLLGFANSGFADDRVLAISGLSHFNDQIAFSMLSVLAEDPQIEVRLAAVGAMGQRAADPHRLLVLEHVNYSDPDDALATSRVRGMAILALGKVAEKKDIALLTGALQDKTHYIRITAARAALDYLQRINTRPDYSDTM